MNGTMISHEEVQRLHFSCTICILHEEEFFGGSNLAADPRKQHTDSIYEFRCFFLKCPCPATYKEWFCICIHHPLRKKDCSLKSVSFSFLYYRLNHMKLLLLLLLSHFSRVRLCATPEMAAHQASPSLGFSR